MKGHQRKLVDYQPVFASAVTELSSEQKQRPQNPETQFMAQFSDACWQHMVPV